MVVAERRLAAAARGDLRNEHARSYRKENSLRERNLMRSFKRSISDARAVQDFRERLHRVIPDEQFKYEPAKYIVVGDGL
jgi:hypothetical protein